MAVQNDHSHSMSTLFEDIGFVDFDDADDDGNHQNVILSLENSGDGQHLSQNAILHNNKNAGLANGISLGVNQTVMLSSVGQGNLSDFHSSVQSSRTNDLSNANLNKISYSNLTLSETENDSGFSKKCLETVKLDKEAGGIWSEAVFLSRTFGLSDSDISKFGDNSCNTVQPASSSHQYETNISVSSRKHESGKQFLSENVLRDTTQVPSQTHFKIKGNQDYSVALGPQNKIIQPSFNIPKTGGSFPVSAHSESTENCESQIQSASHSGSTENCKSQMQSVSEGDKCTCVMCYKGRGIFGWQAKTHQRKLILTDTRKMDVNGEDLERNEGRNISESIKKRKSLTPKKSSSISCNFTDKKRQDTLEPFVVTAENSYHMTVLSEGETEQCSCNVNMAKSSADRVLPDTLSIHTNLHVRVDDLTTVPVTSCESSNVSQEQKCTDSGQVFLESSNANCSYDVPKYKVSPAKVFLKPTGVQIQKSSLYSSVVPTFSRTLETAVDSSIKHKNILLKQVAKTSTVLTPAFPSSIHSGRGSYQAMYLNQDYKSRCSEQTGVKPLASFSSSTNVQNTLSQTPHLAVIKFPFTDEDGTDKIKPLNNTTIVSSRQQSETVLKLGNKSHHSSLFSSASKIPTSQAVNDCTIGIIKLTQASHARNSQARPVFQTVEDKAKFMSVPKETAYTTSLLSFPCSSIGDSDILCQQAVTTTLTQSPVVSQPRFLHVFNSHSQGQSSKRNENILLNLTTCTDSEYLRKLNQISAQVSNLQQGGSFRLNENAESLQNFVLSKDVHGRHAFHILQEIKPGRTKCSVKKDICEIQHPPLPSEGLPSTYIEDWVNQAKDFTSQHLKGNNLLHELQSLDETISNNFSPHTIPSSSQPYSMDKKFVSEKPWKNCTDAALPKQFAEDARETLILPGPKTLVQLLSNKSSITSSEQDSQLSEQQRQSRFTSGCMISSITEGRSSEGHSLSSDPLYLENSISDLQNIAEARTDQGLRSNKINSTETILKSTKIPFKSKKLASPSIVPCSKGLKFKIKLNRQTRHAEKNSETSEVPQCLNKSSTQMNMSYSNVKTDCDRQFCKSIDCCKTETAEEMFQRFQEQAVQEVFKAQLGVGYLSRSLRPARATRFFINNYKKKLNSKNSENIFEKHIEDEQILKDSGCVTETESQTSKKMSSLSKKKTTSRNNNLLNRMKYQKHSIKGYSRLKQDNSIVYKKKVVCSDILAGHKVYVKFNTFENVCSGRSFLVPFFNLGGSRTQFDVEDMKYINKAVVEFEREERSCARHLLYYSREENKATFLRKETYSQAHHLSDKNYKKSSFILEGFKRETPKQIELLSQHWKIDNTVDIEIDRAEIDNDVEIEFDSFINEEDSVSDGRINKQSHETASQIIKSFPLNGGQWKFDTHKAGETILSNSDIQMPDIANVQNNFANTIVSAGFSQDITADLSQEVFENDMGIANDTNKVDTQASSSKSRSNTEKTTNEIVAYTEKLQELIFSESSKAVGNKQEFTRKKIPVSCKLMLLKEHDDNGLIKETSNEQTTYLNEYGLLSSLIKQEKQDDGYENEESVDGCDQDSFHNTVFSPYLCESQGDVTNLQSTTIKKEPLDTHSESLSLTPCFPKHFEVVQSDVELCRFSQPNVNFSCGESNWISIYPETKNHKQVMPEIAASVCAGLNDITKTDDIATKDAATVNQCLVLDKFMEKPLYVSEVPEMKDDIPDNGEDKSTAENSRQIESSLSTKSTSEQNMSLSESLLPSCVSESSGISSSSHTGDENTISELPSPELIVESRNSDQQNPTLVKITSLVESLKQRLSQDLPAFPSWLTTGHTPVMKTKRKRKKCLHESYSDKGCSLNKIPRNVAVTSVHDVLAVSQGTSSVVVPLSSTSHTDAAKFDQPSLPHPQSLLTMSSTSVSEITASLTSNPATASLNITSLYNTPIMAVNTVKLRSSNLSPFKSDKEELLFSYSHHVQDEKPNAGFRVPQAENVVHLDSHLSSLRTEIPLTAQIEEGETCEPAVFTSTILVNSEPQVLDKYDTHLKPQEDQRVQWHMAKGSQSNPDTETVKVIQKSNIFHSTSKRNEIIQNHSRNFSACVSEENMDKERCSPCDFDIEVGTDDLPETSLTLYPVIPVEDKSVSASPQLESRKRASDSSGINQTKYLGYLLKSSPSDSMMLLNDDESNKDISTLFEQNDRKPKPKGSVAKYLSEKFSLRNDSSNYKVRGPRLLHMSSNTKRLQEKCVHKPSKKARKTTYISKMPEPISTAELTKTPSLSEIFGIVINGEETTEAQAALIKTVKETSLSGLHDNAVIRHSQVAKKKTCGKRRKSDGLCTSAITRHQLSQKETKMEIGHHSDLKPCHVVLTQIRFQDALNVESFSGSKFYEKYKEPVEKMAIECHDNGIQFAVCKPVRKVLKRKRRKAVRVTRKPSCRPKRDIVDYYTSILEALHRKAQQLEKDESNKKSKDTVMHTFKIEKDRLENVTYQFKEAAQKIEEKCEIEKDKDIKNVWFREKEKTENIVAKSNTYIHMEPRQIVEHQFVEEEKIKMLDNNWNDRELDTEIPRHTYICHEDKSYESSLKKIGEMRREQQDMNTWESEQESNVQESKEAADDFIEKKEESTSILQSSKICETFEKKDILLGSGASDESVVNASLTDADIDGFYPTSSEELDVNPVGALPQEDVEKLLGLDIPDSLTFGTGIDDSDMGPQDGHSADFKYVSQKEHINYQIPLQDSCQSKENDTSSGKSHVNKNLSTKELNNIPSLVATIAATLYQPSLAGNHTEISPNWKRTRGHESTQAEKSFHNCDTSIHITKTSDIHSSVASSNLKFRLKKGVLSEAIKMSKDINNKFGQIVTQENFTPNHRNTFISKGVESKTNSQDNQDTDQSNSDLTSLKSLHTTIPVKVKLGSPKVHCLKRGKTLKENSTVQSDQEMTVEEPDFIFQQDMEFYMRKTNKNRKDDSLENMLLISGGLTDTNRMTSSSEESLSQSNVNMSNLQETESISEKIRITRSKKHLMCKQSSNEVIPPFNEKSKLMKNVTTHIKFNESSNTVSLESKEGIFSNANFLIDIDKPAILPTYASVNGKTRIDVDHLKNAKLIDITKLKMKLSPLFQRTSWTTVRIDKGRETTGVSVQQKNTSVISHKQIPDGLCGSLEQDDDKLSKSFKNMPDMNAYIAVNGGENNKSSTITSCSHEQDFQNNKNVSFLNTAKLCSILKCIQKSSTSLSSKRSSMMCKIPPVNVCDIEQCSDGKLDTHPSDDATELCSFSRFRKRRKANVSESIIHNKKQNTIEENVKLDVSVLAEPFINSERKRAVKAKSLCEDRGERSFYDCLSRVTLDAWNDKNVIK